jgi:hypothetical protein
MKICVFVASITKEFTLGLGILSARNTSVDLECQTLRLAEEAVPRDGTPAFQTDSGQEASDTCTVRGNSDGYIREPPWSRKWYGRTARASPSARINVKRQHFGPITLGGTDERLECYPL